MDREDGKALRRMIEPAERIIKEEMEMMMGQGNTEEMFILLSKFLFSFFLIRFSWQDLKNKRIRVRGLYGFGIVGAGMTLVRCVGIVIAAGGAWRQSIAGILLWFLGLIPGMMLLILERQTRGAVGSGDGYFFLIAGFYLGGWQTMELWMGSVFVSSLAGGAWMLAVLFRGKEKNIWEKMRKKRLPFLPCAVPVWLWMLTAAG